MSSEQDRKELSNKMFQPGNHVIDTKQRRFVVTERVREWDNKRGKYVEIAHLTRLLPTGKEGGSWTTAVELGPTLYVWDQTRAGAYRPCPGPCGGMFEDPKFMYNECKSCRDYAKGIY